MSDEGATGRLPDFLVVGTMKSATTTLFRWLDAHPDTALPERKEPRYFSHEDRWALGEDWYRGLFPPGPGLTGEASPSYTDPARCEVAARRIAEVLPGRPLVCVVREPAARARSQYLHQVRKARERRPFGEAVADLDGEYVRRSCYHRALRPFLEGPLAARLLVVTFEDLTGDDDGTWLEVLAHLGLGTHDRRGGAANTRDGSLHYTRGMRALLDRVEVRRLERAPAPVRRAARRVLVRRSGAQSDLEATVDEPIPAEVTDLWHAEAAALADSLGWSGSPWARP